MTPARKRYAVANAAFLQLCERRPVGFNAHTLPVKLLFQSIAIGQRYAVIRSDVDEVAATLAAKLLDNPGVLSDLRSIHGGDVLRDNLCTAGPGCWIRTLVAVRHQS